jgi:hypothetical protein
VAKNKTEAKHARTPPVLSLSPDDKVGIAYLKAVAGDQFARMVLPTLVAERNRRAGRNKDVDEWIRAKLRRMPKAKVPELWELFPNDQKNDTGKPVEGRISRGRFAKRVSAIRNEKRT